MIGSRLANSGCATYFANTLSSEGGDWFQLSLSAIGTMTSLKSGLPSRDTWTNGPAFKFLLPVSSRMVTWRRLADVHTPMFARGSDADGLYLPVCRTSEIGT